MVAIKTYSDFESGYFQGVVLLDILHLDSLVYTDDNQGSYDSVRNRFLAYKDSYVLVYKDDNLIGYLCAFPITNSLYEKVMTCRGYYDDNIQPEDIDPASDKFYIISSVIHPEYQAKGYFKYVYVGFLDYMERKHKSMKYVLASVINKSLQGILLRYGFDTVGKYEDHHAVMQKVL